jgi:outer membrane murein-binding lipoprotein Lpp
MTSPQPDLPARMAAVEDRVADLEQHQAQVAPFELAAVRSAVGRVHADVLALGEQAVRSGQKLDQVEAEVRTVARVQIEHGAALAQVAGKVDGLEGKVDGLDHKVDGLTGRVGGLEGKVDGLTGRVGGLEGKVDGLTGRVGGLEGKVDGLEGKVDGLDHKVDGLTGRVGGLEGKVDAQGETLERNGGMLERHGEILAEILRRLPLAGE